MSLVLGSLLFWTWVVVWGAVIGLLGLLLFVPFNPWTDPRRRVMEALTRLWARGVLGLAPGFRAEVTGWERLRGHPGPFVICPNHQSVADIPLMLTVFPQFKFIAKPALFWTPPLGLQMRLAGYIEASRGQAGGAPRVLHRAEEWLRRGANVLVFPEGTRSPDERVQRFGQGPFVLAQRAGVPVLPVAISGTGRIIPKRGFAYRFHPRVRVDILEPVRVEGEPREVASRVRARLQEAVRQSGVSGL